MTDYKHFPRIPRNNQINLDLILFVMVITLVLFAFTIAGKDDKAALLEQGMIKETTAIHAKEQKEADERAALYLYNERARK